MIRKFSAWTVVAVAAAVTSVAMAQPAPSSPYPGGPNPNYPGPVPHIPLMNPTPVDTGNTIGFEYHFPTPFDMYFHPEGGPIIKWLYPTGDPGNITSQPGGFGWEPGRVYSLHEEFRIVPPSPNDPTVPPIDIPLPILDWHEQFIPLPGTPASDPSYFKWVLGMLKVCYFDVTGKLIEEIDLKPRVMIKDDGRSIWFDTFDRPVLPDPRGPVVFKVWKQFEYVGPFDDIDPNPTLPQWQPIGIHEYPTPEPTSIALLGLASVALLRRRR